MAGPPVAMRDGQGALIAHDPANALNHLLLYANTMGQLEVGGSTGAIRFTRNASGQVTSFEVDFARPSGTVTKTRTVTRDASGRITTISAAT